MPDTYSSGRQSTLQLIMVPAVVTLAITILRLVGETQHWSPTLFNPSAGGGLAPIGISWLPLIFGPYFALKLAGAGDGPSSVGKSIGFAVLGLVLLIGGGIVAFAPKPAFPGKIVVGMLLIAAAAALQFSSWPGLAKTLAAYAYAARIPVAIVMFFAIKGNWGTHYDVVPPNYTGPTDFLGKFALIGLLPQIVIWPVFTLIVGLLLGSIAAAIARRGKPAMQTVSG
jgi:hypothetical protein